MQPLADAVFELRSVSYSYRDAPALRNVSVQFRRGERVALLGANGSGKSTLLRLLAGLAFPAEGSIEAFGAPLTKQRLEADNSSFDFRRRVGILFQNPEVQLFNATVFDELAFGPLQLGWPPGEIRERVSRMLAEAGLEHLRDRAPHRLSGGEKKRVALASILIVDPEVLLLDEPVAALDPASQSSMIGYFADWLRGRKTVITATHALETVEEIAERCIVLRDGELVAERASFDLLHDIPLLASARLIRPQHHTHPHVHADEVG